MNLRLNRRIIYLISIATALSVSNAFAQQKKSLQQNTSVSPIPFSTDNGKLQFAVISDLWGGYRSGVFDDAVSKLELLQPQFVMSVGDLINGQTRDSVLVEKQWAEFNNMIKPLSMPFFYVPGNHDINSSWMEKQWERIVGPSYYHFIHKNVLFLCINTQDKGNGIHDGQITYFKKVIENNPDVRWTFVFMHRPVWFTQNQDKQEGYEKIEAALKGRRYTLFSGHHHTYLNVTKQGNKHLMLGSTGGGSDLRGEKFGEFDHITMVTLNNDEQPKILNLKLDGIIKDDVVDEKTHTITSTLIDESWLITPSYVSNDRFESTISPTIYFNNPTAYPLKVSGSLSNSNIYAVSPANLNIVVPPYRKHQQRISISGVKGKKIDLSSISPFSIKLKGTFVYDTVRYEIMAQKNMILNWKQVIPAASAAGQQAEKLFNEVDTAGMISIREPEYLQNKWYWRGSSDCLLQFKLYRDAEFMYVVAFVNDDQLLIGNQKQQDKLLIHFEDKEGKPARFTIYPDHKEFKIISEDTSRLGAADIQLKSAVGHKLIKLMLRLPLNKIIKPDHSVRFNIGYYDQDNEPEIENSTLFWKPVWKSLTDYKNSGTFLLK